MKNFYSPVCLRCSLDVELPGGERREGLSKPIIEQFHCTPLSNPAMQRFIIVKLERQWAKRFARSRMIGGNGGGAKVAFINIGVGEHALCAAYLRDVKNTSRCIPLWLSESNIYPHSRAAKRLSSLVPLLLSRLTSAFSPLLLMLFQLFPFPVK